MNYIKKFVDGYAKWVAYHTKTMLLIVIAISILAFYFSGQVGTKSADQGDALPDDIEVIKAFDIISDNFGGSDSVMIAVEIDPSVPGSDEIRDLRDPRAIRYLYLLAELSASVDDVTGATSAGTLLKRLNGGELPQSQARIDELVQGFPLLSTYISGDYEMALVRISLSDQYEDYLLVEDLQDVIDHVEMPPGLKVSVAGEIVSGPVIESTIGPDMARTSNISLFGIIGILFLLYGSIRYALTPLLVIGLGVVWAFGYFGIVGLDLSSQTSGAISMIMGIGIDFGIQIITRFRYELKEKGPRASMEATLSFVFIPMATTTLAALIGFQAMSMGDLTILAELATIMGYGVTACFFAAITVVPVVAVIGEQLTERIRIRFKGMRREKK